MAHRGRPREFDRDAAVNAAMHLFWEQGFELTSVSQLKAAIGDGISATSFYAAFESKEALYKEALERYMVIYSDLTRSLHDTSIPPREAVLLALQRSAKMQTGSGHPKGCMVVTGIVGANAADSGAAHQLLRAIRNRTRLGFRSCVERGIKSGELRETADPVALSVAIDCFFQGLSGLARDRVPLTVIEKAVSAALGIWDSAVDPKIPERQ